MDSKKNRQTTFLSTHDALAIENAPKQGKKPGPTFKLSAPKQHPRKTPAPKPPTQIAFAHGTKSTLDPSISAARFYTEDGLRIPLYDSRGKRFTHARDGRVILHKSNKKTVLNDLVRRYGGDAMAQKMEKWTKDQIGDWITDVETRAFGNPPKGRTMKQKREEGKAAERIGKELSPMRSPAGVRRMSLEIVLGVGEPQGRVTRSMSEEMRFLLEMSPVLPKNAMEPPAPVLKAQKEMVGVDSVPFAKLASKESSRALGITVSLNGNVDKKRKLTGLPAEPQQTTKKIRFDTTPSHLPPQSSIAAKPVEDTPAPPPVKALAHPQLQSITTSKHQPGTPQLPFQPRNVMPKDPPRKEWFPWNYTNSDLYLSKILHLHKASPHPFIEVFDLTPNWNPIPGALVSLGTPVRVLPLPGPRQHLIVSATSHRINDSHTTTSVHTTLISHRDLENQRKAQQAGKKIGPPHKRMKDVGNPLRQPYLKAGKHGYDWEAHRWTWEGDKDLVTGVGHQVNARDKEKVESGEMSEELFRVKYPARLGGQWPCGCTIPGDDDDSEAE